MKAKEFIIEKTRLDPKCWTGYKKQGTKMKGDTRVNNCVPVKEEETGNVDDADSWESQAADAARNAETNKMSQQDATAGGVAEDREYIPSGKKRITWKGIDLVVRIDGATVDIRAMTGDSQMAYVVFYRDGDTLVADDLAVEEQYKGQGIAKIMYDYVKGLGFIVKRSSDQLVAGKKFWDKNKGAENNIWEQGVAEGSQKINWVKPNFNFEWHEVEEQSRMKQVPDDVRQYYQKHFPNKDAWLKAVQNGKAVVVPPDHAYEIRNAPFDKASLQKVLAPTGHEGPIGPAKEKRVNDLFDKGQVEMPIILKTSQGLWLIGGKTRLGTANYVKGLPAKVWLISGEQGVAEGYSVTDFNIRCFESWTDYSRFLRSPKTSNRDTVKSWPTGVASFLSPTGLVTESKLTQGDRSTAKKFSADFKALDKRELVKIKVGNSISVMYTIIDLDRKEVELGGFVTPKTITNINLNQDKAIDTITFEDGSQFPERNELTNVGGQNITNTIFFPDRVSSSRAYTHIWMLTNALEGRKWTINRQSINEQGVTEDRESIPSGKKRITWNGIDLVVSIDGATVDIRAMTGDSQMAYVVFDRDGDTLVADDLAVEERFKGQGIAATMYDYVKSKGYRIRRSGQQTDAGAAFWNKRKPGQNVWEQGVAEGKDFDRCFDQACKLYDRAVSKNLEPKLVQVADFQGDGNGADPRWMKLPQHIWQHYVVIVGDQVLDPTAKQFGDSMPTQYKVSDLDRLWGKQYQIRPRQGVAEDGTWGMMEETYHGNEFDECYGDMWFNEDDIIDEAEYHGRKVTLGKPMQGDVKKFKVYVKDPTTGNIKKVNFGDPNMRIKKSNPARRRSFRARHNCDNPGPRTKARYWSCRKW